MSRAFLSPVRLFAASIVFAAACTDQPAAPPPDGPRPQQVRLSEGTPPRDVKVAPIDDELLRVAGSVPGFGGMYYDRAGRLNVFLTDTTQRGAAAAAIEPVLGPRQRGAARDFRVLRGRFGFAELKQWRSRLDPEVLGMQGVVFTDIDEARNRVVVAVENAPVRTRVAAALARLGLPRDAVLIEERAPVVQVQTLQDFYRPPVAGLQIAWSFNLCTHGPAAETYVPGQGWDGISYFMTNSHCTDVQGGVENTQYYQPSVAAGNHIGFEVRDPLYFTGGSCPAGLRCRHSDAALVQYDQAWPGVDAFGAIAHTQFSGQFSGSLTFGSPPTFTIWGFWSPTQPYISAPYVGQTLEKVGRTTGWTAGPVTNTCVNTNVGGTNIHLFCQMFVNAGVGGGDSGSPVFASFGTLNPYLYGILWGSAGGTSFVFSPLPSVEAELGRFYYCYC
ncbi:MAG TPA: hypothetical protein VF746_27710 [Longimicrobium sp.]|jgi:hypothetical protein